MPKLPKTIFSKDKRLDDGLGDPTESEHSNQQNWSYEEQFKQVFFCRNCWRRKKLFKHFAVLGPFSLSPSLQTVPDQSKFHENNLIHLPYLSIDPCYRNPRLDEWARTSLVATTRCMISDHQSHIFTDKQSRSIPLIW